MAKPIYELGDLIYDIGSMKSYPIVEVSEEQGKNKYKLSNDIIIGENNIQKVKKPKKPKKPKEPKKDKKNA